MVSLISTSRTHSSAVAFLYPGYASFKTLSQRPASEEELERWLMYWSVLGCIIGVEYVAEWLVSWCVDLPLSSYILHPILLCASREYLGSQKTIKFLNFLLLLGAAIHEI